MLHGQTSTAGVVTTKTWEPSYPLGPKTARGICGGGGVGVGTSAGVRTGLLSFDRLLALEPVDGKPRLASVPTRVTVVVHPAVVSPLVDPSARKEVRHRVQVQLRNRCALQQGHAQTLEELSVHSITLPAGSTTLSTTIGLVLPEDLSADAAVGVDLYAARAPSGAQQQEPGAAAAPPPPPYRYVGSSLLPLRDLLVPACAEVSSCIYPVGLGECCEVVRFDERAARATVTVACDTSEGHGGGGGGGGGGYPRVKFTRAFDGSHVFDDPQTITDVALGVEAAVSGCLEAIGPSPECPLGTRLYQRMRVVASAPGDCSPTLLLHPCSWTMVPTGQPFSAGDTNRLFAAAAAWREAREGLLGIPRPWRLPVGQMLDAEEAAAAARAAAARTEADLKAAANPLAELAALVATSITKHALYCADDTLVPCEGCGRWSSRPRAGGPTSCTLVAGDHYDDWQGTGEDFADDCEGLAKPLYAWVVRFRDSEEAAGEHPLLRRVRAALRAFYECHTLVVTATAANPAAMHDPAGGQAPECIQGHMLSILLPKALGDGVSWTLKLEGTSQSDPRHRQAPGSRASTRLAKAVHRKGFDLVRAGLTNGSVFRYAPKPGERKFYDCAGAGYGVDAHARGYVGVALTRTASPGVGVPFDELMDTERAAKKGVHTVPVAKISAYTLDRIASWNTVMPAGPTPTPAAPHAGVDPRSEALPACVRRLVDSFAAARAWAWRVETGLPLPEHAWPANPEAVAVLSYRWAEVDAGWVDYLLDALVACPEALAVDAVVERTYKGLAGVTILVHVE